MMKNYYWKKRLSLTIGICVLLAFISFSSAIAKSIRNPENDSRTVDNVKPSLRLMNDQMT